MNFILQNEVYYEILNEVRTPTGRISEPLYHKYFYILHYLNRCRLFDAEEYEIGVPMYYPVLEEILMLKASKVSKVLKWFVTNKIIKKVKNHSNGFSSSLYKLHSSIENKPIDFNSISASESRLVKKIEWFHNRSNYECKITDHQRDLIGNSLTISGGGKEYLFKKYPDLEVDQEVNYSAVDAKDYCLIMVYLNEKYCRRAESTRRIYSSVTSMPGHLRKHLLLNELPLFHIDLKNAQILLSVPLIISEYKRVHGKNSILPDDILIFKSLAENGNFYEYVAFKAGVQINTPQKRDDFKKSFYKQIWYSKNKSWKSKLKTSFVEEFPNVWEAINSIKKDDYRTFAVNLQKFEAEIFIDNVLAKLYESNISALSIHDSIVTTSINDLYLAESLLRRALSKYGLKPAFKIEGNDELNIAS
ncbi:hypothetical protein [Mucilaginibacter sp.]